MAKTNIFRKARRYEESEKQSQITQDLVGREQAVGYVTELAMAELKKTKRE